MPTIFAQALSMYGQLAFTLLVTCFIQCLLVIKCEDCGDNCAKSQWAKKIGTCLNDVASYDCLKKLLKTKIEENIQINKIKQSVGKHDGSAPTKRPNSAEEALREIAGKFERLLKKNIKNEIRKLLQTKNATLEPLPNLKMSVSRNSNGSYDVAFKILNDTSVERKMKVKNVMPYLMLPSIIMMTVVPWILPGLKMAVMAVGMVNQMAFTSALFTLIRGYIFDTRKEDHIFYINHGYKKQHENYHNHPR